MQQSVAGVSKRNPLEYGEYLVELLESQGISQKKLAEDLNQNRTTTGHYIKMGRWSDSLKSWIGRNRDYIQNTDLLKAARTSKTEDEVAAYLQQIRDRKRSESIAAVQAIGEVQEAKLVKVENENLQAELVEINTAIEGARKEHLPDAAEECKGDWRLRAIAITFWLLVIPVTVTFTQSVLRAFEFPETRLLQAVTSLDVAAVALSVAVDSLIYILLAVKGKMWPPLVAFALIAGNCAAAYWVAEKAQNIPALEAHGNKVAALEAEVSAADTDMAEVYGKYLAVKWKGSPDPEACEKKIAGATCRAPYTTQASILHGEYLGNKNKLERLSERLEELKEKPEFASHHSEKDLWFHLGYYAVIWSLILVAKRVEKM